MQYNTAFLLFLVVLMRFEPEKQFEEQFEKQFEKEFEKEFDIQIPDDQAENIATVGQAISYIEKAK